MKICFLIHHETPLSVAENAVYLSEAALSLGRQAAVAFADSLACHGGDVTANVTPLAAPLSTATPLESLRGKRQPLSSFDLVWVLSVGSRGTFLDKIQLLKCLEETTRVVNSTEALMYLHSKISLPSPLAGESEGGGYGFKHPETHISSSADDLLRIVRESGGRWVAKPVADMLGREVALIEAENAKSALEKATAEGGYCLMQRYVSEIAQGEKRVLVAGGEVVGQYLRCAPPGEFRTNIHQGAKASLCGLTEEERRACESIAKYLLGKGAVFAGLDLVWPWLLEWNVISPGGLATIDRLGGENLAQEVVRRVIQAA